MARKVYQVVPNGATWAVKHRGVIQSNHATNHEAIDAGRTLARANQPSQLLTHQADETIDTEWTYGDDPPEG